jgi:arylsulfatase A-like enzyme
MKQAGNSILVRSAAAGILLFAWGAGVTAGAAERPNVVLFLADDLGYGDLAAHGNPHVKTPHLDAFARDGVEFTRFYVHPICHPTRASFMTGRYALRTFRQVSYHMDPAEVTVAEMLRAAGYKTAIFGKWHLGDGPDECPSAQGFDEVVTFPKGQLPVKDMFNPQLLHNGMPQKYRGYCMDVFADEAIAFIRQNRDSPFFVYLPANLIHTPLVAPPALKDKYRSLGGDLPTVYGMVESTDTNFGRLRSALKELGLEDNTLLIFSSDNGPAVHGPADVERSAGLHGLKGLVYDGGIRTTCLMGWPAGFKGAAKVNQLAAHIDILPTVLEACGVAAPGDVKLDGRSLLPLARDPAAPWAERTLFIQFDSDGAPTRGRSCATITDQWKLVQPCGEFVASPGAGKRYAELCAAQGRGRRGLDAKRPRWELYDLAADPRETTNLAAEHPEIVEKLRQQYNEWFDDIGDHALWQPLSSGAVASDTARRTPADGSDTPAPKPTKDAPGDVPMEVARAADAAEQSDTTGSVWPDQAPADCPFPKSDSFTGIRFTGRHAEYTHADTWYPSWAGDGNLYSPFTDGTVDKIRSHSGPIDWLTGNARIEGDDPQRLNVIPIGVHKAAASPYGGRYPCGTLVYNGVWYYGTYCLDWHKFAWDVMGPFVGFRISRDGGKSWEDPSCTPDRPLFGEGLKRTGPPTTGKAGPNVSDEQFRNMPKIKMGSPHFVDFGRNMRHSPDSKAYLLGHGATRTNAACTWVSGDQIYLARVTPSPETINEVNAYEFFAGCDAQGAPLWVSDFARIKPILEWNGRLGCVTATWNPGLKRYLLCTTDGGESGTGTFNTLILESEKLTGPWRRVTLLERFGQQAYFVNIPSKFISADGRTLWLCYAANWAAQGIRSDPPGSRYGLCLQEIELLANDQMEAEQ